ncbi:MAG: thioredoxin-dependent thiol peroxidase [Gemmatimonadetes bacterium]|nr:thioredoxin-dependent thiol peroxidase [Gemmatimonadota bacterium]
MESDAPKVGEAPPEFELPSQTGECVRLRDFHGRKHVVLFFYPKDDTPGCTREACDLRDDHSELARSDVVVLGVSRDSTESHARFASKYGLPFQLLSDADGDVCARYGVWKEKNRFGRTSHGIERTTFVIDKAGVLRKVFPRVSVEGHAKEIAAAVATLQIAERIS